MSRAAYSSPLVSPARIASRMCCTGVPPGCGVPAMLPTSHYGCPLGHPVIPASVRGLDQLDQDAPCVLRVDEVHPAVRRAPLRGVVEQAHAALAQRLGDGVDVRDAVGELLDAGAVPV